MIAILGILLGIKDFIGIALVIGILTFIGTAALARYIERGAVIEPGDDEERR
ncbi:Na(+)/H(+) antiporter subunit F1 [compost metagenome]